ncbi:MAG: 2-dehydropantoate 2-reductase, partial [Spirochaetales bacterium]|nr:2-dehydropantoate 2-reductase [Spirochaetales bacterium]
MNIMIYGGGAVGLGVASCLLAAGDTVFIVARPETVAALASDGLVKSGIFGDRHHMPSSFRAAHQAETYREISMDFVLVCTKSYDTKDAARRIHAEGFDANPNTRFILFQNGWGNREAFSEIISSRQVFNARVITGFERKRPSEVTVTVHADDIHIGSFDKGAEIETESLCSSISRGGIPCSVSESITKDLWAKMLYNCSLNSLGAIFGVNYGELADNPHSKHLLDLIINECFEVLTQAGYSTHWENADEYLHTFYGALVPATRGHYPSTLQDLNAGKQTEIDALNG